MSKPAETTIIKKYANRRLYNTGTSTYVTLENLAAMVKTNEEFVVQDAKTGEDITHSVLTQIIFEQENKVGQNMMPIAFLRQLIRFYGDQMQMVVPTFLEHSMAAFSREQEQIRDKVMGPSGRETMKLMEEQVRRNTEMFRQAMAVFNPFMANAIMPKTGEDEAPRKDDADLSDMRRQLAEMQRRIEALDGGGARQASPEPEEQPKIPQRAGEKG
ncbi:polyhydroxyalkanoate synthesis repressor PhaR [Aureimonas psammosilenae]|uniref:polyhydroxyalkanoate synthesis repressor PhaR n=1 Tax=Aureimonas psammosilenae TaxID=2495496 RepID=UPI001261388D|nr:polyhydroxyalkanoate synthesis repressor PhaR [Aureimonas psammosilenae]